MYGTETWTAQKADQKFLEVFQLRCWRRMEEINWANRGRNEILHRARSERKIPHTINKRKANWIYHTLHRNYLLKYVTEGTIGGRRDEGEDVSSYWMALLKGEDSVN